MSQTNFALLPLFGHGAPTVSGTAGRIWYDTSTTPFTPWVFAPGIGWRQTTGSDIDHGVPAGGTTGQALTKNSNTDYDDGWATVHQVPAGGTTSQALTKNSNADYDASWQTPPTATTALLKSLANTAAGTFVVPAGYALTAVYIHETAGHAITGGLKFGTTVGGFDVINGFGGIAVGANSLQSINDDAYLQKKIFSMTAPQTVYFDAGSAWNGASVDIFVHMDNLN